MDPKTTNRVLNIFLALLLVTITLRTFMLTLNIMSTILAFVGGLLGVLTVRGILKKIRKKIRT